MGGSSIAFRQVLSMSAYGSGEGTWYATSMSFRMPTMIILWRAWGIPYSSNLYKCGTTLYPPWVPAFFSSSMILVKAFPSLAFRRPPTFSATNHIGLYRFKTFTP